MEMKEVEVQRGEGGGENWWREGNDDGAFLFIYRPSRSHV